MNIKFRLLMMNFMQFAVWGAYLTSMGRYLAGVGIGANIGWFYSVQGFVSICMPLLCIVGKEYNLTTGCAGRGRKTLSDHFCFL